MKNWIVRSVGVFLVLTCASCLHFTPLPDPDDSDGGDGNGGGGPGGGGGAARSVRLEVSNVTPTVGEEVSFLCVASGTGSDETNFNYQADTGRLIHQPGAADASFIVDASDIGTQISVACIAEFPDGQRIGSDTVDITGS